MAADLDVAQNIIIDCIPFTWCACIQVMTKEERERITDLKQCEFGELYDYFKVKSEERKNMSKEDELVLIIPQFCKLTTVV